jgi:pyridoxal phosphate enzyme (YggS family)
VSDPALKDEGLPARLARVRARIEFACARADRSASEVRLIAVSKFHPAESVREAHRLGHRAFGENYLQELALKADALGDLPDLEWHVIGHVQRNKARLVAAKASCVHTLDSERLAVALDRASAEAGRVLPVLAQVNVAGEDSKSGCSSDALEPLLEAIERCQHLSLRGLMTIPPATEDADGARPHFEALAALRARLGGAARLPELSMGMTQDLECAISCGATMVRVGTAIFGDRPAPVALLS